LRPTNHAQAVHLMALGDMVRGYGPVKEAAAAQYRDDVVQAEAMFLQAAKQDPAAREAVNDTVAL